MCTNSYTRKGKEHTRKSYKNCIEKATLRCF